MLTRWVALALGALLMANQPAFGDEKAKENAAKNPRNVAILIFDGVELLDFTGPAEVFAVAGEGKLFRVFTVAEKADPIRTMGGITVKPEFALKDAPKADILVIPGGGMRNVGKPGRDWIRRAAKDAEVTMSVCMGAFLLADAGLLDGVEATTHHWGIDDLKKSAPNCKVVKDRRFVDAGKVLTTAGVTAGIDGALHLVERFHGKDAARWTAEEWMEHRRERK
jgi:transcriptional regulator GlxA family with amidase domain